MIRCQAFDVSRYEPQVALVVGDEARNRDAQRDRAQPFDPEPFQIVRAVPLEEPGEGPGR